MKLSELGEAAFLRRIARLGVGSAAVETGIGDDCAVVRVGRSRLLFTTDALVEGVHFQRRWDRPEGLGARAFAVNASDVAAMGGVPRWALLSVAVPATAEVEALDRFHRGFHRAARVAGCDLVGGNVSRATSWILTVTLVGEAVGRPLLRSRARPGDSLWVSGAPGVAAVGREALLGKRRRQVAAAVRKFLRPVPRLALGMLLASRRVATAAIDLSDGLLRDLGHLCRASGVGAVLREEAIPLHPPLRELPRQRALHLALAGGEDYELLFTVPRSRRKHLIGIAEEIDVPLAEIGEITSGRSLALLARDGSKHRLEPDGFDHFES